MNQSVKDILGEVKKLAAEYYQLTAKPLGVTGEIGEFEVADKLGLELMEARSEGYDAINKKGPYRRVQIKTRRKLPDQSPGRVSKINTEKDFDSVMLALLDEDFEVKEIWEADREKVTKKLDEPGSISRNVRRQMGVTQFKSIAKKVWPN